MFNSLASSFGGGEFVGHLVVRILQKGGNFTLFLVCIDFVGHGKRTIKLLRSHLRFSGYKAKGEGVGSKFMDLWLLI